mmetsp:Transcript_10958/g.32462  ORF Transcript_10958/g.32462 Transcript_10958/m.32462 type:complete len:448 (+) Transcript_10958:187-1530(+)
MAQGSSEASELPSRRRAKQALDLSTGNPWVASTGATLPLVPSHVRQRRVPSPVRKAQRAEQRAEQLTSPTTQPGATGSLAHLSVALEHHLDVALNAEDNWAALVDARGLKLHHALHLPIEEAGGGNPPGCLDEHRHGKALVENTELALGRLGVGGVEEDASVEERTVHVANHGAHVALRIGLLPRLEDLHRLLARVIPEVGVALVAAVDLLAAVRGDLDISVGVDELTDGRIQGKAVHAPALEANHQLCGSAVHAVASDDEILPFPEDVVHGAWAGNRLLVNTKDCSSRHVAVDVGAAVERIERNAVLALHLGRNDDWFLVLLGNEHCAGVAVQERVDEYIVRKHVQLLLVVSRHVLFAGHAKEVRNARLAACARGCLAREGDGTHEDGQLLVVGVRHHETGQRAVVHGVNIVGVVTDGCHAVCFRLQVCGRAEDWVGRANGASWHP